VVVSTLQAAGIRVDAVYDDDPRCWGSTLLGVDVRGPIDEISSTIDATGVLGIGNNSVRERLSKTLPVKWLTAIHPHAFVHPSAVLGEGSVVFAGAVVQPDVVVGRHSIINTCASLDHDCRVGDFVAVGPDGCLLGTGSSVIPNVRIGKDAIVGAGTVVIRDLSKGCTVVGPEQRLIRLSADTEDLKKTA
jgi:sugar O-acyltransferase (sialic acid O-acetyltransferase NeuD family)